MVAIGSGVEARADDGPAVRRERLILDQLRQQVADAEAEARRQREGHGEAVARSQRGQDQVLIDREVALSNAELLRVRTQELLDRTQQQQLMAAAARRTRQRGRVHAEEGRHDPATEQPAAVPNRADAAADRDQHEIELNMIQPPDESAD